MGEILARNLGFVLGLHDVMPEPADAHEPYYESAAPLVPEKGGLAGVKKAALGCRACHLWMCGTQTVFGEGPATARIMMVGEQPGDKEDLAGHPFVGPAGKLLDEALDQAGIVREDVYLTNAVKHFKWDAGSGGKRIHGKPNRKEVVACKPWLDAELALVEPDVLVLLGATAAQALLGSAFRLTKHRGEFLECTLAPRVIATLHPAAILRQPDAKSRHEARDSFLRDMRLIAGVLSKLPDRRARLL